MLKRMLVVGLGAVAVLAVLGLGAAGGAALTYVALQARPVAAQAATGDAATEAKAGILVAAVDPDGPAAKAGLRRADIVLAIDEKAVNTYADLRSVLAGHKAGDELALKVQRGDVSLALTVMLGDNAGRAYLGLTPCLDGELGAHASGQLFVADAMAGARVIEVLPDTPAAAAGLKAGDVITAVDDQTLDGEHTLGQSLAAHEPGDTVTLTVERPGEAETLALTVTLGEDSGTAGRAYLGIRYAPAFAGLELGAGGLPFLDRPFEHALPFSVPDGVTQGALIGEVAADSPAEAAGLQTGDVIAAVDGEALTGPNSLAEIVAAHKPGDTLTLTVHRTGTDQPLSLTVTLGGHPDDAARAYLGVSALGFFEVHAAPESAPHDAPFRWPDLPEFPRRLPLGEDI